MKQVKIICDNCELHIVDSNKCLSIGSGGNSLWIKNNLPERSMIEISSFNQIDFCSKQCFMDYLFKSEVTDNTLIT